MKAWFLAALAAVWLTMPSCTRHTVILKVPDPIYVRLDVTITVRDELNNIFDKIEGGAKPGTEGKPEPKAPEKQ